MIRTLTDRYLAGLRLTGTRQRIADTKVRGLMIRVGRQGKTWYFRYRNNGPTKYLKLGEYPAIKLANARARALKARALLADHRDPIAEERKATAPEAPPTSPPPFTFADFVPVFVTFQRGRTKSWYAEEQMIKRHLLGPWGTTPIRDITRQHVHEVLDHAVSKGLTIGVNRLQAAISRLFTIALDRGHIDAHPAARLIKRFKEQPRERTLDDNELRALWAGLDAHPGAASDALRLRLLLGQRGEETVGMCWSEIDLNAGVWKLPARRTKNARPHVVALPASALAILKRCRKTLADDEPRVFPRLTILSDEHRALGAIHNGAYEWIDLRRTVATRLAGLSFDETTIGRTLNHAKYGVTGKHYNQHQYVEEIRRALTAWDTELQRILANKPKSKTRVLPMRGR